MRYLYLSAAVLISTLSAIASTPAKAEIYKWIDEDGVVTFSEHKPQGKNAERISTRASSRSSSNASSPGNAVPSEKASGKKETEELTQKQQQMLEELQAREAEREAQVAEIRRDNCDRSRKALSRLTHSGRVRVRGEDGTERVLGEEERQRRIDDAQRGIAANCESIDG